MRFVDEAKITISSGKGGPGCISFRREKFIPKGGPDGGDGGKGGDVVFRASSRMHTLYDFRHKRIYKARNGEPGMGKQKYGAGAPTLYIDVPVGTLVYRMDDETGEQKLLVDLKHPEQEYVAAQGGQGGQGNLHYKSSTNRAPRYAQPGEEGEEFKCKLVLKVIADIGIIGLPNAGKSTFISAVSAARPKIANYPFTTLTPNLGVIENDIGKQVILADIPGLIEGAHEGQGLGHRFLRHVERTRFLLHVLASDEIDFDDPFSGFDLINEELGQFDDELARKPQLEVINKIDVLTPEQLEELQSAAAAQGRNTLFMSALNDDGVNQVLAHVWEIIEAAEAEEEARRKAEAEALAAEEAAAAAALTDGAEDAE